jgi:feruloyl-CoA synthase
MSASAPQYRPVALTTTGVTVTERPDGAWLYTSNEPLGAYPTSIIDRLEHWATVAPDRTLFAQRAPQADGLGAWRRVSYAQAWDQAMRIGSALLARGLNAERPVAILSDNDLPHALLALGCQCVGVPYAPVSAAYSLMSQDYSKLKHVLKVLTPGLVYAADARFQKALDAVVGNSAETLMERAFSSLTGGEISAQAQAARRNLKSGSIAKFLFTSGSTKDPKAVINTHGMLAANQQMILQSMPFLGEEPPVMVDWLPWNHTFGGNHNVGIAIYNGGTLYIDEGKPAPGIVQKTIANLKDIAPTIYFNVPKGYDELARAMQADATLATQFFSRLKLMFYAGASLPQPVWDSLNAIAEKTCGERIVMITGLGMTETSPGCFSPNRADIGAGMVGIPLAGLRAKLVLDGDKRELRYQGPNVTPGYWRNAEETAGAFDEEGYFKSGDALKFVDRARPELGLLFDGRIAEDFKLVTGTWVSVGPLRARLIAAAAPYAQDVVITGHNRDEIGAMFVPNLEACRKALGVPAGNALSMGFSTEPVLAAAWQGALQTVNAQSTGSATRVKRALALETPPSIDKGEVTDKGSINQRAMLTHRAGEVERLYAGGAGVVGS